MSDMFTVATQLVKGCQTLEMDPTSLLQQSSVNTVPHTMMVHWHLLGSGREFQDLTKKLVFELPTGFVRSTWTCWLSLYTLVPSGDLMHWMDASPLLDVHLHSLSNPVWTEVWDNKLTSNFVVNILRKPLVWKGNIAGLGSVYLCGWLLIVVVVC